ncbi:hypothetical protein GCM10018980_30520 [Streptomyces capoamus]|uniref:Uncharacterized protein n=1 Tax=Streptomyces capoamus TaxID=68183 RepID=A0A919C4M1_9ACTN|nr:hypothetical protein GCM10010501_41070 [Streptomyces libani subsp. rufus]GHG49574.1 hypothetical protein GCM10018980_30520 [Streptomyces capoamus]
MATPCRLSAQGGTGTGGTGVSDDVLMRIPGAVRWALWVLWWGCLAFSVWFFWTLYDALSSV